ncbi:MAG: S-layer protein [Candidatus Pacearchaeota archaeon]
MTYVIKKFGGQVLSLACKELSPKQMKSLSSELAQQIIKKLSERPSYPKEIANELKVHEQKIYYHIRKLEKAGIINVAKKEVSRGIEMKYYELSKPCFIVALKEFQPTQKIAEQSEEKNFLKPFIENGGLNSTFVIGSPDPHGIENARSRDSKYIAKFALFLGAFFNFVPRPKVFFDTEIEKDDLKANLIIIGGPIVNNITNKINEKLPIKFIKKSIYSTLSRKRYTDEKAGIIIKTTNPFDKTKHIFVIAGLKNSGTEACMLAFFKKFKELIKGNKYNKKFNAKVIEGIDSDSDGIIDDIKILE